MKSSLSWGTPAACLGIGLAAGCAEIIWVLALSSLSAVDATAVASGVSAALALPAGAQSPLLGLLIHLALSILIVGSFGMLALQPVRRRYGAAGVIAVSLLLLAAIWAFNFFVLLPALSPAFVALMPLPATLLSKLLFGLVMGVGLASLRLPAQAGSPRLSRG